ncbi:MAG TPA: hypothetical protein VK753_12565 [Xanthomonadaceae bacterium]|nr:hypothetical protein [Xanthomonadaceae bacterium]
MNKRDLSRLLRQTNVEDLVDDGIENGSDIASFNPVDAVDETPTPETSKADAIRRSTLLRERQEQEEQVESLRRRSVSWLGLILGACFVVSGIVVFLFPRDTYVYHHRMRLLPSFVEHVTPAGSQAYAVVAVVLGGAVCAYALYRPPK